LAGASEEGICLLEYTDRRMLEHNFETMRRRFGCAVVPGRHRLLDQLKAELGEYFAGKRRHFAVPLSARGTRFKRRYGTSCARSLRGDDLLDELARRVGQPTAQRAVAALTA